jgi:hypothetical protein
VGITSRIISVTAAVISSDITSTARCCCAGVRRWSAAELLLQALAHGAVGGLDRPLGAGEFVHGLDQRLATSRRASVSVCACAWAGRPAPSA